MRIREMTIADVQPVFRVCRDEDKFKVNDKGGHWSQAQLRSWVACGTDVLLVAEEDGKMAGFVLTALHRPTGKVSWTNIYVSPDHRRSGVASRLFEVMAVQLRALGGTYISCEVHTDNVEIQAMLARHGFAQGAECYWYGRAL